jgi:hypothetical protein
LPGQNGPSPPVLDYAGKSNHGVTFTGTVTATTEYAPPCLRHVA